MEIKAPSGHVFFVDEDVWESMPKSGWYAHKHHTGKFYMKRDYKRLPERITLLMQSVVMGVSKGTIVDHINGDTLDNRKENLRVCTVAQNACNKASYKNSISKYKGVSPHKNKWRAQIQKNGIKIHIGLYNTEERAAHHYNLVALDLHGEFARLNEFTTGAY
jgi:hypothetical protein